MRQTARDRDAAEEMRIRRRSKADDMVYDEQKRGNRQIFIITYFFVALFLGMMVYITVFMLRDSADIINNSYNKRQEVLAKKVKRGKILSADGKVLAKTITDKK